MAIAGFLIAVILFLYVKKRLSDMRERSRLEEPVSAPRCAGVNWSEEWHRQWADKFRRQAERRVRQGQQYTERERKRLIRRAARLGLSFVEASAVPAAGAEHGDQVPARREALGLVERHAVGTGEFHVRRRLDLEGHVRRARPGYQTPTP